MKEVIIREARREDASRLLEIYAYYIENTAITFEYTVPSLKEFQNRIQHIQAKYPYLVIEKPGVSKAMPMRGFLMKGRLMTGAVNSASIWIIMCKGRA